MLNSNNKPTCFMMIGLQGSGKSTIAKGFEFTLNAVTISTDQYIEQFANILDSTYNEVHDLFFKDASGQMYKKAYWAIKNNKTIVWDQTNIDAASRINKIKLLKKYNYEVHGVVVVTPLDTILDRLLQRYVETNKKIDYNILLNTAKRYEVPTLAEGFTSILVQENG